MFRTQALKRLKTVRREKKRLDGLRQAAAVAKKEEKKLKKEEKKLKKKEKSIKTPNLFRWGKRVLGKKKKVEGGSSDGAAAERGAARASPRAPARSASQVLSAKDAVAAATDADDEFAATLQNMFEAKMDEEEAGDVEEMFWRTEKGHPLDFLLKLTVRQTEAALVVACEQGDVCCVFRGLDVNLALRRKFVDLDVTLNDLTMRDESVADTGSDFAYMLKQTKRVATEPFVRVKLGLPPHEILDPPLAHTEPRPQVHVALDVRPLQAAVLPSLIARVSHFFLVVLHVQDVGAIGKMASSPLKQFEEAGKMHVEAIKSAAKQGISKGLYLDLGVQGVTLLVPEDAANAQSSLAMVHLGDLQIRTPDPRSTAMRLVDAEDTTAWTETSVELDEATEVTDVEEVRCEFFCLLFFVCLFLLLFLLCSSFLLFAPLFKMSEALSLSSSHRVEAAPAYDERDIIRVQLSNIQMLVGPMGEVMRERRVKGAGELSEWHLVCPVTARVDVGLGAAVQIGAHVDEMTVRMRVPLIRRLVDISTGYAAGCSRTASELILAGGIAAAAAGGSDDASTDEAAAAAAEMRAAAAAAKAAAAKTAAAKAAAGPGGIAQTHTTTKQRSDLGDAEAADIARRLLERRKERHVNAVQEFASKSIRTVQAQVELGLKVELSGVHILLGDEDSPAAGPGTGPGTGPWMGPGPVLELAVQHVAVLLEKRSFDLALKVDVGAIGAIEPGTACEGAVSLIVDSHPDDHSVWEMTRARLARAAAARADGSAAAKSAAWLDSPLLLLREQAAQAAATEAAAAAAGSGGAGRSALSVRLQLLDPRHSSYTLQEADVDVQIVLPRWRVNVHRDSIAGVVSFTSDGLRTIQLTQITNVVDDIKGTVEGISAMGLTGVDAAKRRIRLRRMQKKMQKAEYGAQELLRETAQVRC